MKTFGKVLAILVAVFAVLIIGAVLFLKNVDWDRARPTIQEKVSAATGRDFVIGGHLTVTWKKPVSESGWRRLVPWPTFTAENVRISNPDWAKRPQFGTAEAISFELELLPLLAHKIVIPHIGLRNPVIDLERTLDNRNTWTFKRREQEKSKWDLQLQELAFADGVVAVTDAPTRIDMQATLTTLGEPIAIGDVLARQKAGAAAAKAAPSTAPASGAPGGAQAPEGGDAASTAGKYGFGVKLAGTYRDAALRGEGKVGGVLSLIDTQRPFPLEADVHLGDNHVVVSGTLTDPAKLAALDLQLSVAAPSMSDLYDLLGVVLPDTPAFRTSGHLSGSFAKTGKHFKYENFSGTVGRSDLAGTLEFTAGTPRSRLTGAVHSKRLALADLGPAIGGAPAHAEAAHPAGKTTPGKQGKLAAKGNADGKPVAAADRALPNTPFKTDRWRAMDIDVRFDGASIVRTEALPITDMSTHIIMSDGVLTFDPLKFGVAGGTMTGTIRLDGHKQPLDGKIDIAARHLQLKKLFPTFQPMHTSFGEINGDARLAGRGNSTAALAATANGEVKLLINDGAISNTLLETAGLNVANIVAGKLFGDKTVQINCAAADFVVKDGLLDSRVFAFDTADALINVDGNIDLGTEKMDLNVYPHTKGFRIFSLRSPLYVKGTFKHPDVGVMKGPLALRGGAALALGAITPVASLLALLVPSNKEASPCPALMATAREGLKGAPAVKR